MKKCLAAIAVFMCLFVSARASENNPNDPNNPNGKCTLSFTSTKNITYSTTFRTTLNDCLHNANRMVVINGMTKIVMEFERTQNK